jgi:hypothetical protein
MTLISLVHLAIRLLYAMISEQTVTYAVISDTQLTTIASNVCKVSASIVSTALLGPMGNEEFHL